MPSSGQREVGQHSPSNIPAGYSMYRGAAQEKWAIKDWRGGVRCVTISPKNCLPESWRAAQNYLSLETHPLMVLMTVGCVVWSLSPAMIDHSLCCTWIQPAKPPWGLALPKNIPAGCSDAWCSFVDAAHFAVVRQAGSWLTCEGNMGLLGRKKRFSLLHWWACCLSPMLAFFPSLSSLWDAFSKVEIELLAPSKLSEDLLPLRFLLAQGNLCLWMKREMLKCGFRFHSLSGTSVLGWEVWLKTHRSLLLLWTGRMEPSRKLHPIYRAGNSCVCSRVTLWISFLGFSSHPIIPA